MYRSRIAGVALALSCALAACGGNADPPTQLPLTDLVRFAERYDGEGVATRGVVRTFATPEHYWIEDADVNRVRIVPQSAVSNLVGQRVRVVGQFAFDRNQGRVLEVEHVEVLE